MLLIIFYGKFYSFHRPIMPRLESQLNHGEFKLKSELHIKHWKKRSSVEKKQATLTISQGCEFSQPTNLAAPVVDLFLYFFLYLPNLSLCNSDSL